MPDVLELADRVEALEGPDREADLEIAKAVGLVNETTVWWAQISSPTFTASLDAAMSLLPMMGEGEERRHADFILECTNGGLTIAAMVGHDDRDKCSWGATPALALVAASLRAIAQEKGE